MPDVMEVPPVTRREQGIAVGLAVRDSLCAGGAAPTACDSDIRYLLDLVALLRADLHVAVARALVWRQFGQNQAARAEDHDREAAQHAKVR